MYCIICICSLIWYVKRTYILNKISKISIKDFLHIIYSFVFFCFILQESYPHRNFTEGVPDSWLFGTSETGYMDGELFLSWFKKIFLLNCGRERPVLLILDNHDSHVTLPLVETARANNVILLGMPAHTTHILQPLDVKVCNIKSSRSIESDNRNTRKITQCHVDKDPVLLNNIPFYMWFNDKQW
jgi:hypothetical protein